MASDTTLARPTSGHELAVFGSVRAEADAGGVFDALDVRSCRLPRVPRMQ